MVKRFVDSFLSRIGKGPAATEEPQYTAPTPEAARLAEQQAAKKADETPTIFSYQKEIGLSDEQVQRMKDRLNALNATMARNRELLAILEQQCNALLLNETASLGTIEARLNEIAALLVASQMEDLRTSRDIMAMISSEQLSNWRSIQQAAQVGAHRDQASAGVSDHDC